MRRLASIIVVFALLTVAGVGQARNPDYRSPEHAEGATTISVDEAKWMFDEGTVFIDVRNPRFFARRHVPGAHHEARQSHAGETILWGLPRHFVPRNNVLF
jgi:hypothetical protein